MRTADKQYGFIRRLAPRWLKYKLIKAFGLTPINSFHPEDVFIIGFPKSGHTWFQNLVAGVFFGTDPARTPYKVMHDLVPDVHFKKFYTRYFTPTVFKSHFLPRPEYKRVVYLIRDGRDVLVSLDYHLKAMGDNISLTELARGKVFNERLSSWKNHVETWLNNPYNADMIIVKYEDMIEDTARELTRFCNFASKNPGQEIISHVAERSSFENMQSLEIRVGHAEETHWPKDKLFMRRGKVGSYKDELDPQILEIFLDHAGDTLKRLGYL